TPEGAQSLQSMSSLADTALIEQFKAVIKDRAPTQMVVTADQVNAATVEEIVRAGNVGRAATIYHGEHEGQGGGSRRGVTYKKVKGPYDDTPHGPTDTKMHNKALDGEKQTVTSVKQGAKTMTKTEMRPEFLISGSPNLTPTAMNENTESAAVVRYPGIAK